MWSELRADAVRRELAAISGRELTVDELQSTAAAVIHRVIPYDASCWGAVDPGSGVVTGSVTLHFEPGPELVRRFAEIEASGDDVHSYSTLAARRFGVARLSDAASDAVAASPRVAEIYRPLGFGHELRATFAVDDSCWGIAELLRAEGSSDFSDVEVAFMASVTPVVAKALRAAALRGDLNAEVERGSAVVIVDAAGDVVAATPQASERLAGLSRTGVLTLVAAVRLHGSPRARVRMRDAAGAWVTVTASPLESAAGGTQVAVVIEPTVPAELTDLLLAAHGLSPREQEVCRQVLGGRSTAEIAAALYISANTVQDHLKSIFAKTGLRSRRELVAQLSA